MDDLQHVFDSLETTPDATVVPETYDALEAELIARRDEVARLGREITDARQRKEEIENRIIAKLEADKLKTVTLESGHKMTSVVSPQHRLPPQSDPAARAEAMAWLDEHGAPLERGINPSTLASWCRERLAEGETIPEILPCWDRVTLQFRKG